VARATQTPQVQLVFQVGLIRSSMGKQIELVGRVKNTFLDFTEEGSGDDMLDSEKPNSDPTSSRSVSYDSFSGPDRSFRLHDAETAIYKFRNDLQPDEFGGRHDKHTEQKRKHNRPNKMKRNEFRQYVDKLKEQLEQDPAGFDVKKIEHQQNLIRTEQDIERVDGILERHRAHLLAHSHTGASSSSSMHASVPSEPKSERKSKPKISTTIAL